MEVRTSCLQSIPTTRHQVYTIVYIGGMNTAPRYAKKLIPGANMAVLDWG